MLSWAVRASGQSVGAVRDAAAALVGFCHTLALFGV